MLLSYPYWYIPLLIIKGSTQITCPWIKSHPKNYYAFESHLLSFYTSIYAQELKFFSFKMSSSIHLSNLHDCFYKYGPIHAQHLKCACIFLKNWIEEQCSKQDISPICNLCCLKQDDTYLHLLSCCTNKHINDLRTNTHNKAIHALADTLLAHLTIRGFTVINASKFNNKILDNTLPSWLFSCTCYLPRCKCLARLQHYILCV